MRIFCTHRLELLTLTNHLITGSSQRYLQLRIRQKNHRSSIVLMNNSLRTTRIRLKLRQPQDVSILFWNMAQLNSKRSRAKDSTRITSQRKTRLSYSRIWRLRFLQPHLMKKLCLISAHKSLQIQAYYL